MQGERLLHTPFEVSHEQSSTLPLRSFLLVVIHSLFTAPQNTRDGVGFILASSLILLSVALPTRPQRSALLDAS